MAGDRAFISLFPPRMETASLEERFLGNLRALGVGTTPGALLVAVSGGCDSVALCYLLRFCLPGSPLSLTVAHLDHAMRPSSADDALWLRGLCSAWGLPLVMERLPRGPTGEAEAREARHAFLRRVAREAGADLIATAHHADDQAETVLFRALRGSGLRGLSGIRPRAGGLLRPLLPFWRSEIEAFALSRGLVWREDASNQSLDPARNRLRHEVIPLLEARVAPGARRSLVSLAGLAWEAERALESQARRAIRGLVSPEGGGFRLAREGWLDYDLALASRILRNLLRRFGVVLSRPGTRRALQFIIRAPSGRELQLPGGLRMRTELDSVWLGVPAEDAPDVPVRIESAEGQGVAVLGGRRYAVDWSVRPFAEEEVAKGKGAYSVALPLASLSLPLLLRGWSPGDRLRTTGGTKSLKKLFLEHRVPRSARRGLPVLADSAGGVLWVAGLSRAPLTAPRSGEATFFLTARHA